MTLSSCIVCEREKGNRDFLFTSPFSKPLSCLLSSNSFLNWNSPGLFSLSPYSSPSIPLISLVAFLCAISSSSVSFLRHGNQQPGKENQQVNEEIFIRRMALVLLKGCHATALFTRALWCFLLGSIWGMWTSCLLQLLIIPWALIMGIWECSSPILYIYIYNFFCTVIAHESLSWIKTLSARCCTNAQYPPRPSS